MLINEVMDLLVECRRLTTTGLLKTENIYVVCNMELRALQNSLQEIEQLGAKLVTISPEMPDHSLSTIEKNNLAFDVLYDKRNKISDTYGLTMQLPHNLVPIY